MIGLDANVLVRYLIEDDKAQTDSANRFLATARDAGEVVYLSLIVLCETYLAAIHALLSVDVFQFEEPDTVRRALESCRKGKGDFADYLIGHLHMARGCRHTATFDRALKAAPGFTPL